jgi:hypothetical protein
MNKEVNVKLRNPMRKIRLNAKIPPMTIWRLKMFKAILKIAVWVGGFDGIDIEMKNKEVTNENHPD